MVNHKVNHKTIELINSLKGKEKIRVLFVCLGNICRSCTAEEIMRTLVRAEGMEADFLLDSAGLSSYHEGEKADARMRAHAARRGIHITHLSRPVRYDDFFRFDLILGMDDANVDRLREMAPGLEEEKKSEAHGRFLPAEMRRLRARSLLRRRFGL